MSEPANENEGAVEKKFRDLIRTKWLRDVLIFVAWVLGTALLCVLLVGLLVPLLSFVAVFCFLLLAVVMTLLLMKALLTKWTGVATLALLIVASFGLGWLELPRW